ncbi:carboxypeptidase regulatory-like domain-containing protein [Pseudomonas sp. FW305-70]|uniref:carboxypeptidase regulatory-like domain-containing protein n=1 Tax=Pseudomonas sp. FW305-70 TaxID=2751342 RepID=UPI002114FE45|nr:carboxypeptidase regulatory-like domain-containing protein [Pseudomonas sp. FW305-70]
MTTTPPKTSAITPNTQNETIAKVTFDEVRDSNGHLVGNNSVTFDKNLNFKGTAGENTELWIRDEAGTITDVTSEGNIWIKEVTLRGFQRYSLYAIEKFPPQDRSSQYVIVLATETPIIDTVIGKNGPIKDGDPYDGDSLEFSGYAPPGMEVEAFNGDTTTGKKTMVDTVGRFQLTLDGLTAGDYSIKIRATNGKESSAFTFRVILDVKLSLDDVLESEDGPSVPEGCTTGKTQLIIKGHAMLGESIQLLNGGAPIKDAVATADPVNGAWKILLDVTDGDYRLAARADYGDGEITAPPRTFTVESTIKPHNTRVYDSDGLIQDNGTTPYNHVIVRGDAGPVSADQAEDQWCHRAEAGTDRRYG